MKPVLLGCLFGLCLAPPLAAEEIYRSVDSSGTIVFSSRPGSDAAVRHPLSDTRYPETAPPTDATIRTRTVPRETSRREEPVKVEAPIYRVIKSIDVTSRQIVVSGRISGGDSCRYLAVKAIVRHSGGSRRTLRTTAGPIGNGIQSVLFEAVATLPAKTPQPLRDWSLDDLFVTCQKR